MSFNMIEFVLNNGDPYSVAFSMSTALTLKTLSALLLSLNDDLRDHTLSFALKNAEGDKIFIESDADLHEAIRAQMSVSRRHTLCFLVKAEEAQAQAKKMKEQVVKKSAEEDIEQLAEAVVVRGYCNGNEASSEDFQGSEQKQIEVSESIRTKTVEILRDDQELAEVITCRAGETLSNLRFVVRDENGDAIDMLLQSQEGNSWIECDWVPHIRSKKMKSSFPVDCALPNIDVPEDITASPFKSTLIIMLDNVDLKACLSINIVAFEPARWSLVCAHDLLTMGVAEGEIDDLQKKISGVVCTDIFGNMLPCDASPSTTDGRGAAALSPVLEVFALTKETRGLEVEDNIKDTKPLLRIPLQAGRVKITSTNEINLSMQQSQSTVRSLSSTASQKKRKRSAYSASIGTATVLNGFVLPSRFSLDCLAGYKKIVLRVVAEEHRLSASNPGQCRVLNSLPRQLLLSCETLGVAKSASEISVELSRFSSVSDLCIHIRDAYGGESSLGEVFKARIEVLDDKERNVFSTNNITSCVVNAALNYDFSLFEDDDANSTSIAAVDRVVEFVVKMSYRRGQDFVFLPPARLRCTVKRLNNVVDLRMQAFESLKDMTTFVQQPLASQAKEWPLRREGNTYSLSLPCDAAPPTFTLQLETDDGHTFLPEVDTFSVSTKRREGKEKSRLSFMELFDCEIDEDNGRLFFIPSEKLVSKTICVFEFEIVYKEKRDFLVTLPEDKKLTKIKLHVQFLLGSQRKPSLESVSVKKIQDSPVSNSNAITPKVKIALKTSTSARGWVIRVDRTSYRREYLRMFALIHNAQGRQGLNMFVTGLRLFVARRGIIQPEHVEPLLHRALERSGQPTDSVFIPNP